MIAAIVFAPINRRFLTLLRGRGNLAALATLALIIFLVIVPAMLLMTFIVQEASAFYTQIQAGRIDLAGYFARLQRALPDWLIHALRHLGLGDIGAVQARMSTGFMNSLQLIASQAYAIGQGAFGFVVGFGVALYLGFFLLRDGAFLVGRLGATVPLDPLQRHLLAERFVEVIRATVRGTIIVAIAQGATGGLVFWLLGISGALIWGVLMAVMSLLPAIGAGIVWVPVVLYLLATGAVGKALLLAVCGTCVIGMIDNVLRPILVGRDTRMPDYLVLIATLGGIELFGFNGIVVGPVIAALFMAAWNLLATSRRQATEG
ncbi:AI-2E family transporter [Sphingomonas oryzagri]